MQQRICEMDEVKSTTVGEQMHQLITLLYPICRSITGNGVRQSFEIIKKFIPLTVYEVPSGKKVFDWTVPKEWNIRDGYIKNARGEKIIDFKNSNLHVLNYSIPVHKKVQLAELKEHLYSAPDHPDWVPYRTSYYNEVWGFCISHNQLASLEEDEYEVFIDSSLEQGSLTYAECFIPGELSDEVLIFTHTCHPSLCNDNLSGISLTVFLIRHLMQQKCRYSYRFVFAPTTIGSIVWLAENESNVRKIKHGLVCTLVGDTNEFTYKRSRRHNAEIDRIAEYVLQKKSKESRIIDFFPFGYDERQFCSPGFDLPVGCLSRTTYGRYPEYHTSADNLEFVKASALQESLNIFQEVIQILENNKKCINQSPKAEPQLGKYGLYSMIGANNQNMESQIALLWVLNASDGELSLLDIAVKANMKFEDIKNAADRLLGCGLLKEKREEISHPE
jgi:aminopeptidase-like protein